MRVRVLRVLLLLLLLLLLLFVHAGVCCVASVDVYRLVKFLSRCGIVTAFLQQSEFRGGQSPNHLPPIFHRHPSSGRGIFVVVLRQAGQID